MKTARRNKSSTRGVARKTAPETDTRSLLLEAASAAFNEDGYLGTDTNRIARRAGFAPQTFYRHFPTKLAAFVAVYEQWQEVEAVALSRALDVSAGAPAPALARVLAAHHRRWAVFRRSLRRLAVEEDVVREARARGRRRQLEALARLPAAPATLAARAAALLAVERLCDALADGEHRDLGIDEKSWLAEIERSIARARGEL